MPSIPGAASIDNAATIYKSGEQARGIRDLFLRDTLSNNQIGRADRAIAEGVASKVQSTAPSPGGPNRSNAIQDKLRNSRGIAKIGMQASEFDAQKLRDRFKVAQFGRDRQAAGAGGINAAESQDAGVLASDSAARILSDQSRSDLKGTLGGIAGKSLLDYFFPQK